MYSVQAKLHILTSGKKKENFRESLGVSIQMKEREEKVRMYLQ